MSFPPFCDPMLGTGDTEVTKKNKHLHVSLGLTGGLSEYKSTIASMFSVSYLIKCYTCASDGRGWGYQLCLHTRPFLDADCMWYSIAYPEFQPDSQHWSPLPCVCPWGNFPATGDHANRQNPCSCPWAWRWPWPLLLALAITYHNWIMKKIENLKRLIMCMEIELVIRNLPK